MLSPITNSLGLPLTKTFGHYYSMDGKKVPLLNQVKDVHAILSICPNKRFKLTILVADIHASYGMLLRRTFCKEMVGEIKMD